MNNILVPPKLNKGKVMPVSGITPIIDPILRITWDANHPKTPATNSFNLISIK